MGVTLSLLLIAVGAVLKFAVSADTSGINLQTTGVILMIVGGVGLVMSLIFWSTWGGFRRREVTTRSVAADGQPVVTRAVED
jgi:hypothetical protein